MKLPVKPADPAPEVSKPPMKEFPYKKGQVVIACTPLTGKAEEAIVECQWLDECVRIVRKSSVSGGELHPSKFLAPLDDKKQLLRMKKAVMSDLHQEEDKLKSQLRKLRCNMTAIEKELFKRGIPIDSK